MSHGMEAIIFDLDGTLLDSLDDLADSANTALAALGYPQQPTDNYRFFVGNGMEMLIRRAAPQNVDDETLAALAQAVNTNYAANWRNKTRPYNGIPEMLDRLTRMALPMAVLSNKPHRFTTVVIEHFFPTVPFACVQGKQDGGKAKPDPAPALDIACKLGVAPQNTVFVGDSSVDMDTATAAGMFPLGVLWGFRPEEELRKHGARKFVKHPLEIIETFF